jgi:hypothetical protein
MTRSSDPAGAAIWLRRTSRICDHSNFPVMRGKFPLHPCSPVENFLFPGQGIGAQKIEFVLELMTSPSGSRSVLWNSLFFQSEFVLS